MISVNAAAAAGCSQLNKPSFETAEQQLSIQGCPALLFDVDDVDERTA
jgi:hypothetical protein